MSQHANTITDRQYAHLRDFLTTYRDTYGTNFAIMSRRIPMSHGAIANVVNIRKPSLMFVKRLAAGLEVSMDDLLGPDEPEQAAYHDVPGDPPPPTTLEARLTQLETDLSSTPCLELITITRQVLDELRGIHALLRERHDKPELYPRLF